MGAPAVTIVDEIILESATQLLHLHAPVSNAWHFKEVDYFQEERNKLRVFGLTDGRNNCDENPLLVFIFSKWAFNKCHHRQFADMHDVSARASPHSISSLIYTDSQ